MGDRQEPRADLKKPLTMQQLSAIFDFFEGRDQKGVKRLFVAPFSSTCSAAEQVDEKEACRARRFPVLSSQF